MAQIADVDADTVEATTTSWRDRVEVHLKCITTANVQACKDTTRDSRQVQIFRQFVKSSQPFLQLLAMTEHFPSRMEDLKELIDTSDQSNAEQNHQAQGLKLPDGLSNQAKMFSWQLEDVWPRCAVQISE